MSDRSTGCVLSPAGPVRHRPAAGVLARRAASRGQRAEQDKRFALRLCTVDQRARPTWVLSLSIAVRGVLAVVPRLLGCRRPRLTMWRWMPRLLAVEKELRPGNSGEVSVVLAQARALGRTCPRTGGPGIWVGPHPPGGGGGNLPVSPTPTPVANGERRPQNKIIQIRVRHSVGLQPRVTELRCLPRRHTPVPPRTRSHLYQRPRFPLDIDHRQPRAGRGRRRDLPDAALAQQLHQLRVLAGRGHRP